MPKLQIRRDDNIVPRNSCCIRPKFRVGAETRNKGTGAVCAKGEMTGAIGALLKDAVII